MSKYDIAIIGMGCIFPKANSVSQYWKNILEGDEYVKEMPTDLWHLRDYYSAEPNVPEKTYTLVGSFIEDFEFPFLDYRLPPKAMKGVDPAQLVTLEAAKEALKDANIEAHSDKLADAVTVIGASGVDGFAHTTAFLRRHRYFNKLRPLLESRGVPAAQIEELAELFAGQLEKRGHQWNPAIASVGAIPSSISNRVAQVFGVKGYNMTVDAACGSSFVAVDVACQALMAGDARIAITGGTDLGTNPPIYVGFSRVDGLSKSGHSNPFDHTADGLIIGEGVGMAVLKRMEDAIADGDRIRAVIRGIGSSSDGAGQAIYAPSVEGRSLAFKRGLKKADTSPHDVQFLEAHATSTVVGDANEYDSISTIYAPGRDSAQPLKLGSVKGQIGHLKAAAGIAGLIKTVLAMENGVFPHMPRYTTLTPHAKLASPALEIPTETSPWEPHPDGRRVAAVTTSGFGGVNYHLILEQAEVYQPPAPRPHVSREMAVVGVTLRVAGADTVEKFWDNVTRGRNVMVDADPVELDWADHLDAGPENERITTRVVSRLEDYDPHLLKHKIFPKAVSQIAPTQLLALDLADRLLEDAGLKLEDQKDIAVSVGSMHDDYFPTIFSPIIADEYAAAVADCAADSAIDGALLVDSANKAARELKEDGPPVTEHTLPGWMTNVTAGRIANKLNLKGPNFTVDSACSSGLAALVPAQYQLMFGDVDMVISGGLNRQLSAEFTCGVCALGAVAEKVARPFDADGAGFLIGEGGVFFLLKRLEDARRDGDDIIAVIHSVHGSSEAESKTMVAPTESAVRLSIRNALARTDIPIEHIGVVDTHGSANPLSDLVEARSLAAELRPQTGLNPVQITAIKSHIGHIYGGSGAASMLSTIQALRTGKVPGIRNLKTPRPEIEEIKDRVQPRYGTEPLAPEVKAGAVNSLGLGGANYFAVVTAPKNEADKKAGKTIPTMTQVSQQDEAAGWEERSFRSQDGDSSNIFICLAERRQDLGVAINRALKQTPVPQFISEGNTSSTRLAVTFENQDDLRNKLASTLKMATNGHDLGPLASQGIFMSRVETGARPEKLAFCLPGQGGQYITMGRHLYDNNRHFKEILDTVHDLTSRAFDFDLLAHMYGDPDDLQLKKELGSLIGAQASVFAVEVGIARVLAAMGVKPDVILGQSFGEIAALVVAGVWDIETGFEVVSERIKAAELASGKSSVPLGMMSIICSPQQRDAILKMAGDKLVLTNINAPNRFIFSGEMDVIKRTSQVAESFGANARILDIASAFHSYYMEPAREPFYKALSKLPCNPPGVPVISTVTGEYLRPENINSEYLAKHFSTQLVTKVDLVHDVRKLHDDGVRHFIEIGPGWALTKMVSACLEGRQFHMVPTLHPKVGDKEIFRRAQAFMMAFGHLQSAAGRRKLDGLFSPDFISYVQTFEPSVINLIYEVHGRFLGHVNGDGELKIKAPQRASIPAAVPLPRPRPEPAVMEKSTAPALESHPAAQQVVSAGSRDVAVWVGRLKEKLVEATGYPAEMLEENLDLEADLGVDSVQRAEIWTSFVHEFGLDPDVRPQGVRSIANLALTLARMSGPAALPAATAAPGPAQQPQAPEQAGTVTQQQAVWIERLREKLVEATGYPPEMLEEHLDLEADLGVDSVQRAEIWTLFVSTYGLDKDVRPKGVRTIANIALTLAQMSVDKEQGGGSFNESSADTTTIETGEKTGLEDDSCELFLSTATQLSDSALEPFAC
ncbi:MAG: beta-ketoacyl synthase N-terminal-like domain-containing protein, partial [Pseudomonadota bacterium]